MSAEEEKALNILLLRAGGEEQGAQLYKLGWAAEDNAMVRDGRTGELKYDPEHKIPICLEANQMSYHLLSWAPPSQTDMELEHEFHGEDFSKGTYTCIMHFLSQDGSPVKPTASIIERIIPVLKEFSEIATATRKGFTVERNQLRTKKIAEFKQREKEAAKKYENDAEAILGDGAPAFEGNPTSFPGPKGKSTADIISPDEYRTRLNLRNQVHTNVRRNGRVVESQKEVTPTSFAFSARKPKTKE